MWDVCSAILMGQRYREKALSSDQLGKNIGKKLSVSALSFRGQLSMWLTFVCLASRGTGCLCSALLFPRCSIANSLGKKGQNEVWTRYAFCFSYKPCIPQIQGPYTLQWIQTSLILSSLCCRNRVQGSSKVTDVHLALCAASFSIVSEPRGLGLSTSVKPRGYITSFEFPSVLDKTLSSQTK